MRRSRERGGAMLVTLILITSILAGAATLVSMQLGSTRSTDLVRTGLSSGYCAESGLVAARSVVASNYTSWPSALQSCATSTPCSEPGWLRTAIGSHDLDGDGVDDFTAYLRDDDDELTGGNDRTADTNLRVYLVVRCVKYPDNPREVRELIEYTGNGTRYEGQLGGYDGNGNTN